MAQQLIKRILSNFGILVVVQVVERYSIVVSMVKTSYKLNFFSKNQFYLEAF